MPILFVRLRPTFVYETIDYAEKDTSPQFLSLTKVKLGSSTSRSSSDNAMSDKDSLKTCIRDE